MAAYVDFAHARGLAEGTIRNRSQCIRMMIKVTGDIQVESLTPRHMERVFNHYNWAVSTRNDRLSTLKLFFHWCRSRRFMSRENDPLLGWRAERVPDAERTRIPVQEWQGLFDAVQRPQERIILA